jgi:hypothetical protein
MPIPKQFRGQFYLLPNLTTYTLSGPFQHNSFVLFPFLLEVSANRYAYIPTHRHSINVPENVLHLLTLPGDLLVQVFKFLLCSIINYTLRFISPNSLIR